MDDLVERLRAEVPQQTPLTVCYLLDAAADALAAKDAEIARLQHDVTRQMTIANEHVDEVAQLKALVEEAGKVVKHRGGPLCPARYSTAADCNCGVGAFLAKLEDDNG